MQMTPIETGYSEALDTILENTPPLGTRTIALQDCMDHVAAQDISARVDAPSADASLKDGYALNTSEIPENNENGPIQLPIAGSSTAGQKKIQPMKTGTAMRILTGGRVPPNANTVVAEEDVRMIGPAIEIMPPILSYENILARGSDIKAGDPVIRKGEQLTPGTIGYMATAGCQDALVYSKPCVALIATGDEIRLPGQPLSPGALYASNIITVDNWCRRYGFSTSLAVSKDHPDELERCLVSAVENHDVVITSGGAWTGDKDLTAGILTRLGWKKYFHRLRLGPGKAAGFGILNKKPVFILPGGPPSSIVAFLTLVLPGLMNISGFENPGLPKIPVTLAKTVKSQTSWTHAEYGTIETRDSGVLFHPIGKRESRLKSIATAQSLLLVPEGRARLDQGQPAWVYDLRR